MSESTSVVVVKEPSSEELVEVPMDSDGTLPLTTLESQFAGATGLKFKNPATGAYRAIRVDDGKLLPPDGEEGWGTTVYEVVVAETSKRRAEGVEEPSKRAARQPVEGEDGGEDGEERYDPRKRDRADQPPGPASHPDDRRPAEEGGPTGRVCYKCGGQGHIAVMCPSPEGSKDNPNESTCHLCRGRGHFQARCPNTVPRNVCWKCGMYGHIGRECGMGYADPYAPHDPYGRPSYPGPMYGGFDRACYVCGERGHLAARCPRSTHNGEKLCHICHKPGHLARDCKLCRICLGEGHRSYDCPHRQEGGMQPHYSRASPAQGGYDDGSGGYGYGGYGGYGQ